MSVTLYTQGSVFLIHWGDAEMRDMDIVMDAMRAMKRGPGGLFWISLIPEDAGPPSPEMARACASRISDIVGLAGSMHQVFEGTGFFVGFKRSVLTGILLTASKLGAPKLHSIFRVHGSLEQVFECAPYSHRTDLRIVLDRLALARSAKTNAAPPPSTSSSRTEAI